MEKLYRITDIKIMEKKNLYGTFYDIDNLTVNELEFYIGELIRFENKFYMVSTIDHNCYRKRKPCMYKGKNIFKKA